MVSSEEILRRLAVADAAYARALVAADPADPPRALDRRSVALLRLGGSITAGTVGAVLRIADVNPFEPGFTLGGAAASLGRGVVNLLLWALANGWAPALIGVAVVMPIWLLWRLLSVPFRH